MAKNLLSTSISSLLDSVLREIKNVQDTIVKSKLNDAALKEVAAEMDDITKVVKGIANVSDAINKIKFTGKAKSEITKASIVSLKEVIEKIIEIASIIKKNKKSLDPKLIDILTGLTYSLKNVAVNILLFSTVSMGGLVFLVGTLALLGLRFYIWVFTTLFDAKTMKSLKQSENSIQALAVTTLILSSAVILLALTGLLVAESWKQFLMLGAFVLLITSFFFMISLVVKFMKEEKVDQGILYIAATVAILSLTIVLLVLAGQLVQENLEQIGVIAAFCVVVVGMFAAVAFASKWIQEGSKQFLYIAATVAILSGVVMLLILEAMLVESVGLDSIGKVFLLVSTIVGAVIGVAFASKFIQEGAKSMIILAGCMIVMSVSLLIIAKAGESLNWETIGILGAVIGVLTALVIGLGVPPIAALATTGTTILLMISGALLIISTSLLLITKVAEKMKELGITAEDTSIMTTPIKLMAAVVNEVADSIKIGDVNNAAYSIIQLANIAKSIGIMGDVLADMASLKMPIEFNKDGKATKWRTMTPVDFTNAALSAIAITQILTGLFADETQEITLPGGSVVSFSPISQNSLDNITWSTKRKIKMLSDITSAIGRMAEVIAQVAALNMPTEFDKNGKGIKWQQMTSDDFSKASQNIATIATTILTALTNPQIVDQIDNMSKSAIQKMQMIFDACGSVGNIVQAIKDVVYMNIPYEFDDKGKAIKYKTLTEKEILDAEAQLVNIMTFYLRALTSDEISGQLDSMSKKSAKNMERVMTACSGVSNLVQAIKDSATFSTGDIAKGINNIQSILVDYANMLNSLFVGTSHIEAEQKNFLGIPYQSYKMVMDSAALINVNALSDYADNMKSVQKTLDPFKNIISTFKNIQEQEGTSKNGEVKTPYTVLEEYINEVSKIEKIDDNKVKNNVDNFVRFIDKSNSINIDKIKSVTEMFGQMAEFSKSIHGDFDKMADVLNDKVVDHLSDIADSLKTIVGNIPGEKPGTTESTEKRTETYIPGKTESAPKDKTTNNTNLAGIEDSLETISSTLPQFIEKLQALFSTYSGVRG